MQNYGIDLKNGVMNTSLIFVYEVIHYFSFVWYYVKLSLN